MTAFPKGVCPGCQQPRQILTSGFVRLHKKPNSTTKCPGSGQAPLDGGRPAAPVPPPGTRLSIPAPTEPTWGRSCDAGDCNAPSVGWRLFRGQREWLPVCGICMGTAPQRARVYDRDLEGADA